MRPSQCPPEEQLSDFLFGRGDEPSAAAVVDHVRKCAACQTTLNSCNEQQDTVVATLKHSGGQPEFDKEPELQDVLDQISELWSDRGQDQVNSSATVVNDATMSAAVPLGPYRLIELLGEGGMGTVFKAEHTRLEKIVAVKVLSDRLATDPQAVARFDREMKAVGKVDHPNIVRATDAGEQDGCHYLAMEFVDGADLHRIVQWHGPLCIPDACEAVRQAALGIEHAHSLGLIHRDLKPSNLMVSRGGQVKVLDLGLARLRAPNAGDGGLTDDFQVMGTADYMPPEQALKATEVDHRVDIYSLGCTLYALLCGQPPFSGAEYDEPLKKLIAHDRDEPTAMIQRRPDVPLELSSLIDKTLAKSPIDRLAAAVELAETLQPFTSGTDLAALVAKLPQTQRSQGVTSDMAKHVAMTDTIVSQRRSHAVANAVGRRIRIGLTFLLLGGVFAALLVLRFRDGEGTIVVEIEGDQVAGSLDNGELLIEDKQRRNTYRLAVHGPSVSRHLKPGEYKIQVVNDAAGLHLLATEFTIKRNDRTVVKAYIEQPIARASLPSDRTVAEWAIRKRALVSLQDESQSLIVDRTIALPDGDFRISKIDFAEPCGFTDAELSSLAELTQLRELALQDPQLTDRLVDHLARSPNLGRFELRFDRVAPNGLHLLQRMQNVTTLYLNGTRVEDADVEAASKLDGILWLGLQCPHVTNTSLGHVGTMRQLQYLHLLQTPEISDAGLSHIEALPNLTQFFALGASITDEGLQHITVMKRMEWLNLGGTQISDDGLKKIAEMVGLKRLTIAHTQITNVGITNLLPLSNLYHLDLADTQVTDAAVDDLAAFPQMKDLRVGDRLSAGTVEALQIRLPHCTITSTTSP